MSQISISDALPNELNFVMSSFKQSLRNAPPMADLPNGVAFAALNPEVNAIVDRSAILVAREGGRILGWLAFEVLDGAILIHYCYTRQENRRRGVARDLLAAVLDEVSDAERVVYNRRSPRFDAVAERYELEFVAP